MILSDVEIIELAKKGMISPYIPIQVREVTYSGGIKKLISFGVSSYGYDLTLSKKDFRIFRHIPGRVVDPKRFDPAFLIPQAVQHDGFDEFFVIPGNSYALGVSHEKLMMPPNVTAVAIGKSTYARVGLIANITPIEAGWEGYLTLEFSNSSPSDLRIYAGEGCCQLLFFRGKPCMTSYAKRSGKYQGQEKKVTLARV